MEKITNEAFRIFGKNEIIRSPKELVATYQFYIGDIPKVVTVKIFKNLSNETHFYEQSHNIKTPVQASEHITSEPFGNSLQEALDKCIKDYTDYYNEAIQKGNIPTEDWLIVDEYYKF